MRKKLEISSGAGNDMIMKLIMQFSLIIGVFIVALLFTGFIRLIFIVGGALIGHLFGVNWIWSGFIGYCVYKVLCLVFGSLDLLPEQRRKKRKSKVIDVEGSSSGPSLKE